MKNHKEILENLVVYNPVNKKIRYGHNKDGGYVIIDGYQYDVYLSAGLATEVSFDVDFAGHHSGIPMFAFDGTTERPKNLPQEITFVKKNIDNINNLKSYVEGHKNAFIKMDIEGYEWQWMIDFNDSFEKVRQLTIEVHVLFPHLVSDAYINCHCLGHNRDMWSDLVLNGLKTINKTHNLVHLHQNIFGPYVNVDGIDAPAFMELTFLRKDMQIDGFNREDLPIKGLDFPTWLNYELPPAGIEDKLMNYWPFKQ